MKKKFFPFLIFLLIMSLNLYPKIKVRLELSGGIFTHTLDDLNQYVVSQNESFEDFKNYLTGREEIGAISNFTTKFKADLKTLDRFTPLSINLGLFLNKHFILSAGIEYFKEEVHSQPSYLFQYDMSSLSYTQLFTYKDLSIRAEFFYPYIAFSFLSSELKLFKGIKVSFETTAGIGYSFSKIKARSDRENEYGVEIFKIWEINRIKEMYGEGKGLGFHAGGKLNLKFYKYTGIFIEAKYIYSEHRDIYGSGSEKFVGVKYRGFNPIETTSKVDTWEGEWYMRGYYTATGNTILMPENNPDDLQYREGSFSLNFSGIRFLFGAVFYF